MNLGDLAFKDEDFDGKVLDLDTDGDRKFVLCNRDAQCIAEIANKLLAKRLEKAQEAQFQYIEIDGKKLACEPLFSMSAATHKARLVCIEEIK